MLKLKIGKNYLITDYNSIDKERIYKNIAFIMTYFNKENKILLSADYLYNPYPDPVEVVKILRTIGTDEIYLLTYLDLSPNRIKQEKAFNRDVKTHKKELIYNLRNILKDYIKTLHQLNPNLKIKIIPINRYDNRKLEKIGIKLLQVLEQDSNSIVSSLNILDDYKMASTRMNEIPKEIQIVDNDIKKLQKDTTNEINHATLDSLKYLNLIDDAKISDNNLIITLKELPIYPSEELGKVFAKSAFIENPYLFKTAKYIYKGGHFKMGKTVIKIDKNFYLHFVKAVDNTFNNMLEYHNWSGVGYPHFGNNGFCAGEFNDAIANCKRYGLEYYFIALKQYLTTANMRDLAGYKVWWYPIYDNNENLVYCAGFDILLNEKLKFNNPEQYERIKDLPWKEKIKELVYISFNDNRISRYSGSNLCYTHINDTDKFLELLKEKEPEEYKEIMKGRK